MKILCSIFLIAIVCYGNLSYAQINNADAVVALANGRALIRNGKNAAPRRLKKGEPLYSGQQVNCTNRCKLQINYCNVPIPISTAPNQWVTILAINCGPLDGARGGAERTEKTIIISPQESEVIHPDFFSLRWKPFKSGVKINLSLKIYLGEEIWRAEKKAGNNGSFASESLNEALAKAQKENKLHLVIGLTTESQAKQQVKFNLISAEDQQNLARKLEIWKVQPSEILKFIGLGTVYSEYELYSKSAQEFENALDVAQKQKADLVFLNQLRKLVVMANYKAYNDLRVKKLCLFLRKTDLPCACSQSC
jgi:hypothetical protein